MLEHSLKITVENHLIRLILIRVLDLGRIAKEFLLVDAKSFIVNRKLV